MKKFRIPLLSEINLKKETVAKLKKMLPGIISTAVILAIVLITVFQSTDGFTTMVETEPAKIVTERNYMSFTAYTLKNEKLLSSNYSGGIYYLAENAQRVNPGDELAKVYSNNLDENTVEALEETDRCIEILEESLRDGALTLGESKEVTDRLSSIYYNITRSIVNGNASDISSVADELLILLNKINMYSGSDEDIKKALREYKKQKAELEKNYSGNYQLLKTDTGGYFFKDVDGYENVYSSSDIENLTYESFFEMTDKPSDKQKYVGKLLIDYRWYMIIPTVKGISDTYSVGAYYDITFPDSQNRTIEMQLDNIIFDSTGSKSIMVFACGVVDKSFDYSRVQQVSIINKNVSGYRVPKTAVCEISGHTGVYILKDGMASFRKASILYEGEDYYIISSQNSNSNNYFVYLEPNDNIITDCKNMYEGKVIGG